MSVAAVSVDSFVEAFEDAYARDGHADITDHVPPPGHPLRLEVLRELVRIDLEHGWRRGRPLPLEDYRRRFPELFRDSACLREILFEEYRLREQATAEAEHPATIPSSPGDSFPSPGERFGHFRLVAELGRGAFARVFLAGQATLADRPVVVKIAADLFRESQALAQLQHTHIVPIHSAHRPSRGRLQAVCMPCLGVVTLADVLAEARRAEAWPGTGSDLLDLAARARAAKPVPPAEIGPPGKGEHPLRNGSATEAILWLGACLADGLAHAHERGILHRDLKPANVLLTDDGRPMLLDFNLAEDIKEQRGPGGAQVGGTLPYMAPEQLEAFQGQSRTLDGRVDVYALGAMLYELLTGQVPFRVQPGPVDAVVARLLDRQRRGPADPGAFHPTLSPAERAIVRRCLEPDPHRRYPSAAALREDLERHLAHLPLKHTREPSLRERARKWFRRHPRAVSSGSLGAVALASALLLAGLALARDHQVGQFEAHAAAERLAGALPEVGLFCLAGQPGDPIHLEHCDDRCAALLASLPPDLNRLLDPPARAALDQHVGQILLLWARVRGERARLSADPGRRRDLLQAALHLNERARTAFPTPPRALHLQRADLLRLTGRDAEQAAENEPVVTSDDPLDQALLADAEMRRGRPHAALQRLDRVMQSGTNSYWLWFARARCHERLGDDRAAAAAFSTCLALVPHSPPALFGRGLARLRLGEHGGAVGDLDQVVAQCPDLGEARLNRALARLGMGQPGRALADLDAVLAGPAPYTRVYFLRAQLRERLGDVEGARKDRAEGLRRRPGDELSWVARAFARLDDDPHGALADLDQALVLHPASRAALHNRAHVLAERLGRHADAVATLDRLLELWPEDLEVRAARGVLLARLGRHPEARADARRCLGRPLPADVLHRLGCIHALTAAQPQQRREALVYLSLAVRQGLDPGRLRADRDLAALRDDPEFRLLVGGLP